MLTGVKDTLSAKEKNFKQSELRFCGARGFWCVLFSILWLLDFNLYSPTSLHFSRGKYLHKPPSTCDMLLSFSTHMISKHLSYPNFSTVL